MPSFIRPAIILAACTMPLAPCLADGNARQDTKLLERHVGHPTLSDKLAHCNTTGRFKKACRTTPLMK